jgi:hypothetical protein
MNCAITSANNFSGQSAVTSRIFPVQSAVSVRKSTPDRPFVCPILMIDSAHLIVSSEFSQLRTTAHIMVTKVSLMVCRAGGARVQVCIKLAASLIVSDGRCKYTWFQYNSVITKS